jgi:hypothetical protein
LDQPPNQPESRSWSWLRSGVWLAPFFVIAGILFWRGASPPSELAPSLVVAPQPQATPQPEIAAGSVIRVPAVEVQVEPRDYSGPCGPQGIAFIFRGVITVEGGPGEVAYQFERSDGATGPVETLTITAPGHKSVETVWGLGQLRFEGWEKLIVLRPARVESKPATFRLACR